MVCVIVQFVYFSKLETFETFKNKWDWLTYFELDLVRKCTHSSSAGGLFAPFSIPLSLPRVGQPHLFSIDHTSEGQYWVNTRSRVIFAQSNPLKTHKANTVYATRAEENKGSLDELHHIYLGLAINLWIFFSGFHTFSSTRLQEISLGSGSSCLMLLTLTYSTMDASLGLRQGKGTTLSRWMAKESSWVKLPKRAAARFLIFSSFHLASMSSNRLIASSRSASQSWSFMDGSWMTISI